MKDWLDEIRARAEAREAAQAEYDRVTGQEAFVNSSTRAPWEVLCLAKEALVQSDVPRLIACVEAADALAAVVKPERHSQTCRHYDEEWGCTCGADGRNTIVTAALNRYRAARTGGGA